jgi:hypothetical protein
MLSWEPIMLDTDQLNARGSERFFIRQLDDVVATIEREIDGDAVWLKCEPVDISEGGIRLRVESPLEFEESIKLAQVREF